MSALFRIFFVAIFCLFVVTLATPAHTDVADKRFPVQKRSAGPTPGNANPTPKNKRENCLGKVISTEKELFRASQSCKDNQKECLQKEKEIAFRILKSCMKSFGA